MASKYSEEPKGNFFEKAEQLIQSSFGKIITVATERRDQLLVQLFDLKQEYLNKEATRQRQYTDIDKLIRQLIDAGIQQNNIVKLQEEQIKNLKDEQKKYLQPTPIPFPSFDNNGLNSLIELLEKFGAVTKMNDIYTSKINPVKTFGKTGSKKGELDSPRGILLEADQRIYVADSRNGRIQIFSKDGKFIEEFGKGQVKVPYSIALDDSNVFVCDWGNDAVVKFSKQNNKLLKSTEEELYSPRGMTVDIDGELYVANSGSSVITVFSSELKYMREIGKDKLTYPVDVKIHSNTIFVADNSERNNIHIFSKSDDLLKSIIKLENGSGSIFMCFDIYNNIIISDYIGNSIQIYQDEHFIHRIDCKIGCMGIAITKRCNIICVRDDNLVCIY